MPYSLLQPTDPPTRHHTTAPSARHYAYDERVSSAAAGEETKGALETCCRTYARAKHTRVYGTGRAIIII